MIIKITGYLANFDVILNDFFRRVSSAYFEALMMKNKGQVLQQVKHISKK